MHRGLREHRPGAPERAAGQRERDEIGAALAAAHDRAVVVDDRGGDAELVAVRVGRRGHPPEPPRWTATLVAICALLCAYLAAHQFGPFVTADPFIRTVQVQAFLAAMAAMAFVLSIAVFERRIALGRLRDSDYRYRSFIEISAEALWRVELLQPMPLALPVERQVAWLREHARIMECSRTYQDLDPGVRAGNVAWRPEVPWCAIFEQSIATAAKSGYSIDGLRFSMDVRGQRQSFITSFSGVVENDRLLRLWGVARDVTELTALNARLLREQDRLKSYARQIVTAEEKARRATAVDLHDGIAQSLVGMAMTLEVAASMATPMSPACWTRCARVARGAGTHAPHDL